MLSATTYSACPSMTTLPKRNQVGPQSYYLHSSTMWTGRPMVMPSGDTHCFSNSGPPNTSAVSAAWTEWWNSGAWQPPIPAPLVNAWKEHNMSPSAHTPITTWCGKRPSMGWLHGLIYPTLIQRYGTAFAQHCTSAPLMPALLLLPHQPSRLLPWTRMPLAGWTSSRAESP